MNFLGALTPFYLLGLAAIAFPLVFHLIRRTPSGETMFSSLMFLQPSPPRITRKSRLDNILLLILRAIVIGLLAFAFTRPLFRSGIPLDLTNVQNRGVVVLLDVSASMQRDGVWEQAVDEVNDVLNELESGDQVALFVYDESLRVLVDFHEEMGTTESQVQRVRSALEELRPGWYATDLPLALTEAADQLLATSHEQDGKTIPLSQLILISDMQAGSELVDLQGYEWPETLRLAIRNVSPAATDNAAPRLLRDEADLNNAKDSLRVRVANSIASEEEQFSVHWLQANGRLQDGHSILVPKGESRVIKVPLNSPAEEEPVAIRLVGDQGQFDNDFYLGAPRPMLLRVGFLGQGDADTKETLPYFLSRALIDRPKRQFEFVLWKHGDLVPQEAGSPSAPEESALQWLVVAATVDAPMRESIVAYAEQGGRVLVVLPPLQASPESESAAPDMAKSRWETDLSSYLDASIQVEEASLRNFALLGDIDFRHPVFQPFADPRFSDFTGIHFWKHRRLQFPEDANVQVAARFDDGAPFLVERRAGQGSILVMTSGWTTDESQLALSTKFLPLVAKLAGDRSREMQGLYYDVGEVVTVPEAVSGKTVEIRRPDGRVDPVEDEQRRYLSTDMPGRYEVLNVETPYTFAVNVTAAESETNPLRQEELEAFGISMGDQPSRREQIAAERELRDRELEGQQKLWLWLIVGAVVFMLAEMAIAGRIQARRSAQWESTLETN